MSEIQVIDFIDRGYLFWRHGLLISEKYTGYQFWRYGLLISEIKVISFGDTGY